jgi:hypothetical protein
MSRREPMGTGLIAFGMTTIVLFAFLLIGGPMLLMDWLRNRRQEVIRRQIVLTEAIDGRLGAIVAPTVRKPLWGPWQIQIAVPFARPATVGMVLAVAHEVLSIADRMNPDHYQIVLTPKEDATGTKRKILARRFVERRPRNAVAA